LPREWLSRRSACGIQFAAASACALLAACNSLNMPGWPQPAPETAATASAWVKPGADAASVQSAFDDCLAVANTATQSDFAIDQDTAATRSSDLQRSDFARTQMQATQQTSRDRAQSILSSCMTGKGFSPAR
jgi:hypothetical protein